MTGRKLSRSMLRLHGSRNFCWRYARRLTVSRKRQKKPQKSRARRRGLARTGAERRRRANDRRGQRAYIHFRISGVVPLPAKARIRSEEHTSELQSLIRISYAVSCLKTKKENYQLIL